MRTRKGKALMLIMPVLLLAVLIFVYRDYEALNKNNEDTKPTQAPQQPLTITPTVTPTPSPSPTPSPTPTPAVTPVPMSDSAGNNSGQQVKYQVYSGKTPVNNYSGEEEIVFGPPESYSKVDGITTFRGNNHRNGAAFGNRNVIEKKLEIVWNYGELELIDPQWPGVGWTGQPLIIRWPENVRKIMNIYPEFRDKDLVEVIQAALDGKVHFLDLETGKPTRPAIEIGFPIKGTPAVDPRGYPILYCGMGVQKLNSGKSAPFYYRIFNLINQEEIYALPGNDPNQPRNWGAFDSSGLVHAETDTLFQCGENGLVYKIKLNTRFDIEKAELSIEPVITKYRYTNHFTGSYGIENSPAIYRDLMYFADNGGMLQCVDINTFTPKWCFNLKDDTDSTIVIEETEDGVFLYTGNEMDRQGDYGKSTIRKINALTGEQIWERSYECWKDPVINGGLFGTPAVGTGDISNLVFFNIAKTGTPAGGRLIAVDKETGEEVWVKVMNNYGWSSPTLFKSDDGTSYMIYCDSAGYVYLIDPKNGETLDTVSVERNVEASPAIFDDMIVIGSYARKIFGIKIK